MSDFSNILDSYLKVTPVPSVESEQFVDEQSSIHDAMIGEEEAAGDSVPVEIQVDAEAPVVELQSIPEEEVGSVNTAAIIAEAKEEAEGVKTVQNEIQCAEDAIASLEATYEVLNASLESGGLNQVEAAMLHLTVGHLIQPKTMKVASILPSVESHGGIMSRSEATVASMEGIVDTIKQLKQDVAAKIADWTKRVRNWWIRINDWGVNVTKRATVLENAVAKLGDVKPYAKQISIKQTVLCIDNVHQGGNALLGHLGYMGKVADDFLNESALSRIHDESKSTLARLTAVTETEREWLFPKANNVYSSLLPTQNKHILAKTKGTAFEAVATKTLLGDKAIVAFNLRPDVPRAHLDSHMFLEPDATNWLVFDDANSRFTYETQEVRYNADGQPYTSTVTKEIDQTDGQTDAATKAEISKLLAAVKDLCKTGLDYRQSWDKRNAAFAKFITEAPAEAKESLRKQGHDLEMTAEDLYSFEKKYNKIINRTAKGYWNDLMHANLAFIAHMYKVCDGVLVYCSYSLDNLEA